MAETEIKLINGKTIADTKARSDIDKLKKGYYTGDASGIKAYLDGLASNGEMVARFSGTYTISSKIVIPAGMTIEGGTFIMNSKPYGEDGVMFSAAGDNVRLVGVTLKSNAHDQTPSIYEENNKTTTAKASNIKGLYSANHNGVAMIDCVCDKIIPARINGGSVEIKGNKITDTPMFVWASDCDITVSDNDVTICDTGLDHYYHIYYVDKNAELVSRNNRISCDTATAYFDVFHLMTAKNTGTYHASGVVDGDVITGNFQHIIDSHYADLIIRNCTIVNTNTTAWTEFGNQAHSEFTYENCILGYENDTGKGNDSSMTKPVEYNNCTIRKSSALSRNSVYNGCRINQTLSRGAVMGNVVDVYNSNIDVSGTFTGMCIMSSEALDLDFVGNRVTFANANQNDYLFRGSSFSGNIRDNVFRGAKTATLWYSDLGGHSNNTINGTNSIGTGSGGTGEDGATFTPSVDTAGNLSWTNDKGLDNPATVNIKGPAGTNGSDGYTPVKGTDYFTEADKQEIAEQAAGLVSIPNKLPNPNALTFTGAVTGSYDGSAPLTVEIPSGGDGSTGHNITITKLASGTIPSGTDPVATHTGITFGQLNGYKRVSIVVMNTYAGTGSDWTIVHNTDTTAWKMIALTSQRGYVELRKVADHIWDALFKTNTKESYGLSSNHYAQYLTTNTGYVAGTFVFNFTSTQDDEICIYNKSKTTSDASWTIHGMDF